jgi:protein-tyrosine phosphatase
MRYGFGLLVVSIVIGLWAVLTWGFAVVLLWPAAAVGVVGAAHLGLGPVVFGKGPAGRHAPGSFAALLPYLVVVRVVWHVWRRREGSPAHVELLPGIRIGRRLLPEEFPEDVRTVVDLTCELPATRPVDREVEYHAVPVLDGQAPRHSILVELLRRIGEAPGTVYVHCANGIGRTALVAAAILLWRGRAASVAEALAEVRSCRPGARLSAVQRRALERLLRRIERETSPLA